MYAYESETVVVRTEDDEGRYGTISKEANALLIAEAGTVATETGLTPRQLAEQRADLLNALEACLRRATPWHDDDDDDRKRDLFFIEAIARAAIAKAKGETR